MRRSLFSVLLLGVLSLNALAHLGLLADTAYAQEQAPTPTPASTLPFIGPGATFLPSPTPTDSQSTSAPAPTPTPVSTTSETKSVSSFCKEEANRLEGSFLKVIIEPMCNLTYSFLEGIASFFGDIIQQGSEYFSAIDLNPEENYEQFWELARSATNYFIVIGLIIAAFSNVTRWQVETFSIKKILPALIIGFLLANLSLFICRLVIDLSDSIAVTASDTLGRAVGAENTNGIGKFFEAWLKGIFGIGNEVGNFLSNPFGWTGTIGGLLKLSWIPMMVTLILPTMAIFALIPPLLAFIALWAIFIVRHYVVLFLVIVSPLAFISMAFPFSQRWFQAWWKQLINWVFMKPIAFTILMLGTVAISQPIYDSLVGGVVSFIAGMAAIYYAVTVPFKLGGTITSSLARLSGSLGRSAMYGAAGAGQALERRSPGSRLAAILRTPATLAQVPGIVKTKLEHDKARVETGEKARAARGLGQHHNAEVLQNKLVAEKRKEIEEDTLDAQIDKLFGHEGKDQYMQAAIWSDIYKNNVQDIAFMQIDAKLRKLDADKNNPKAQAEAAAMRKRLGWDTKLNEQGQGSYATDSMQQRAIATMVGMGAQVHKQEEKDKDGKVIKTEYKVTDNGFAGRMRGKLDSLAMSKGKIKEVNTFDNKANIIFDEKQIIKNSIGYLGDDPQDMMRHAKKDTWLQYARDDDGNLIHRKGKDDQGNEIDLPDQFLMTVSDNVIEEVRKGNLTGEALVEYNARLQANVRAGLMDEQNAVEVRKKIEKALGEEQEGSEIHKRLSILRHAISNEEGALEEARKIYKPGSSKSTEKTEKSKLAPGSAVANLQQKYQGNSEFNKPA